MPRPNGHRAAKEERPARLRPPRARASLLRVRTREARTIAGIARRANAPTDRRANAHRENARRAAKAANAAMTITVRRTRATARKEAAKEVKAVVRKEIVRRADKAANAVMTATVRHTRAIARKEAAKEVKAVVRKEIVRRAARVVRMETAGREPARVAVRSKARRADRRLQQHRWRPRDRRHRARTATAATRIAIAPDR